MMQIFKIHNESELEKIRQRLNEFIVSWSDRWMSVSCQVLEAINASSLPAEKVISITSEYSASASEEQSYFCNGEASVYETLTEGMLAFLTDSTREEYLSLSKEKVRVNVQNAINALREGFEGLAKCEPGAGTSDWPIWEVGSGWVVITITVGRNDFDVALSPHVTQGLVDLDSNIESSQRSVPLSEIMAEGIVSLEAKLCDVNLSVSEFRSLKVGDVVMSDTDVSALSKLLAGNEDVVASGRLVASNGMKAIQIEKF